MSHQCAFIELLLTVFSSRPLSATLPWGFATRMPASYKLDEGDHDNDTVRSWDKVRSYTNYSSSSSSLKHSLHA